MRNLILCSALLFFGLCPPLALSAQTQDDTFQELRQMMRRMQENMRMPLDSAWGNGQWKVSPDSSSFFYFHFDTSFNQLGDGFFDLSPFGQPGQPDFFGFDQFEQLFDQFFQGMDPLRPRAQPGPGRADDGQTPNDDGLLPEERLRLQEEKGKPAEGKPKSKVSTIRI